MRGQHCDLEGKSLVSCGVVDALIDGTYLVRVGGFLMSRRQQLRIYEIDRENLQRKQATQQPKDGHEDGTV